MRKRVIICFFYAVAVAFPASAENIYYYGVGSLKCEQFTSATKRNKLVYNSYAQGWLSAFGFKAGKNNKKPDKYNIPIYLSELSNVCKENPSWRFMEAVYAAQFSYIGKYGSGN